jgi:hypothetical protein
MSLMCLPQSVYIPQVHQVYLCMFRLRSLDAVVPSLGYGLLASRMRARASYGTNVQHIMMIQSYPYLNATKYRLLRNGSAWALSGDNKSHRNNRYRHMRILCAFLTISHWVLGRRLRLPYDSGHTFLQLHTTAAFALFKLSPDS